MATLQDIQNAIAAEKAEEDKIVALLGTMKSDNDALKAQLAAAIAANDPAALQAVVDKLTENTNAIDAAITAAGTP